MKNKKGKIIKVVLGKNINCSAIWADLFILFYCIPIPLVASLVSAYLFRRQFKKNMTLEDEIIKRKERAKKLKLEIRIVLITISATIIAGAMAMSVTPSRFPKALSYILLNEWPFLIPSIIGLALSFLIGRRILYSRWVYLIMPFIVLATIIIGGIVMLFVLYGK